MRLSEGNPFKTCAKPQTHDRKLSGTNRYENEMVLTYRDLNCSRASPIELSTAGGHYQEAVQYLPKGCSRKMPPFIFFFLWGRLLEHSFLEHLCLDHFSVIQGKFYMQRFSNTSFGRTLPGSNFGGLLLEQTFCRHSAAFPH